VIDHPVKDPLKIGGDIKRNLRVGIATCGDNFFCLKIINYIEGRIGRPFCKDVNDNCGALLSVYYP